MLITIANIGSPHKLTNFPQPVVSNLYISTKAAAPSKTVLLKMFLITNTNQ